jgi:hypothetical protein
MSFEIYLSGFAFALGIVPGLVYNLVGGDGMFKNETLAKILHYIHHAEIGALISAAAFCLDNLFAFAFGLGMFMDDALYHSISANKRKVKKC